MADDIPRTTVEDRMIEGREAFLAGKGLDTNPYGFRSGRADWNRGWMGARDMASNQTTAATMPRRRTSAEWVICPWCGHKHGDAWEWANRRTETRCDGCDNMFTVEPEYEVIYRSFVTGEEKP